MVKAKLLNTNDGKTALSMRALEEEMVDTSVEEKEDLSAYTSVKVLLPALAHC